MKRVTFLASAAACALVRPGRASAQTGVPRGDALATGILVRGSFAAPEGAVPTWAAVFPLDAVTVRVRDHPDAAETGTVVRGDVTGQTLAAINGGYATDAFAPDGLLEIDGTVRNPPRPGLSGIAGARVDGVPVIQRAGGVDPTKLRDALQAGPFIVDPGGGNGIRSDDGTRTRRSAVLLTNDGRFALVATASCTLSQLAGALLDSSQSFGVVGVERALALEGGASTGLYARTAAGALVGTAETGRIRSTLTVEPRHAP